MIKKILFTIITLGLFLNFQSIVRGQNTNSNTSGTERSGLLSQTCLNKGNLNDCIKEAFFPSIGLPGDKIDLSAPETSKAKIFTVIGLVINFVTGLLGIVFLIIVVYAGIERLIAADDEEKLKKSKERLRNGVTGLIITLAAYSISFFVYQALLDALK